ATHQVRSPHVHLRGNLAAVSAERSPGHPPEMPAEDDRAAAKRVPDLDHTLDASGEDPLAVGVERHREHVAGMAVKVGQLAAGRHLPKPNAAVLADRGDTSAVRAECDR